MTNQSNRGAGHREPDHRHATAPAEREHDVLFVAPGERLSAGRPYLDLANPRRGWFSATPGEICGRGQCLIAHDDVPRDFWDRLVEGAAIEALRAKADAGQQGTAESGLAGDRTLRFGDDDALDD